MTLSCREYCTPAEAAQVVGRSRDYWTQLFDQGRIVGYRTESGHRQLLAASVREYLESLHVNTTPAPMTLKEARRAYYAKTTTARCS